MPLAPRLESSMIFNQHVFYKTSTLIELAVLVAINEAAWLSS